MSQLSVLIVEDEAILAAHLASKVKLLGYRVIGPVPTGEEALDLIQVDPPNIALLDIRLDGHLDGIETAVRLKQLRDIPVIFLTAHSDQETLKRASTVGPFGYILKPFEERDLATQLEVTLYKHQAEASLRQSEERYRAFIGNSSEGIWRMEFEPPVDTSLPVETQIDQMYRSARLVECNDAMGRMYGFSNAEGLIGTTLDFMLPASDPSAKDYLASIIKSGYRATNLESSERNVFGHDAYFLNNMVGIVENGRLVRLWGTQQNITDRKCAEEAIRESEARTRIAQQAARWGVFEYNYKTGRNYWSVELEALYGLAPGTFEGTYDGWSQRVHPADRQEAEEAMQRALTTNEYAHDFRVVWDDGTVHWLFARAKIFRDVAGAAERMLGVNVDITERKQAEQALRHSEEQLELISDAVPALISYVNNERRYVTCNEAYTTWFGVSREEVIGKTMAEVVGEEAWANMAPYVDTALQGQAVDYETEAKYRYGVTRWIHAVYTPHRGTDGEVTGIVVMVTDISARKRAEAALRESELRFRMIADSAPVLIWMNGLQGCEFVNHAYVEFIGAEQHSEVANYEWAHYIHDEDRTAYVTMYLDAMRDRAPFDTQFRFRRADGQFRWMRSVGRPRLTDQGELVGYVGASIDITDIREAQDRLQRWSQELEQAVRVKTSELLESQDRLRALATEVGLAEQRERKRIAAELHDHLQQMLVFCKLKLGQGKRLVGGIAGCGDLMKQVDDVLSEALTYSRTLVAELCPPVLREFGLAAALKWLGEHMSQRHLHVSVAIEENLRPVPEEHAVLVFQSVRELLINVAKHAETTHANVHMRRDEKGIRIEVRDQGAGFDVSVLRPRDGAQPTKFGIFSIRERMKAFGGELELISEPGKGTSALLALPLQDVLDPRAMRPSPDGALRDRPVTTQRSATTAPSIFPKALTVLLVDDHAMMRQGLRSVLEAHVDIHIVGEASDGQEAVTMVQALEPAVVVMDINMPRLNGIEATAQIKAQHPGVRVIGLSVNAGPNNREAMLQAGADMLLTKEAAVEDLYRCIQSVVPSP
ncbi:MAG TPA: PAS domain S-box protein [Nitrospira sp.]|nr:PAS domain S-box protein [Nitrospira sp.]